MANPTSSPLTIIPSDLTGDCQRLNKRFQVVETAVQAAQATASAAPPIVTAPAHYNSDGTPGQVAFDTNGAFYFCYQTDRWARINSSGYNNSF